jgi:hypothetical protein
LQRRFSIARKFGLRSEDGSGLRGTRERFGLHSKEGLDCAARKALDCTVRKCLYLRCGEDLEVLSHRVCHSVRMVLAVYKDDLPVLYVSPSRSILLSLAITGLDQTTNCSRRAHPSPSKSSPHPRFATWSPTEIHPWHTYCPPNTYLPACLDCGHVLTSLPARYLSTRRKTGGS